MSRMNFPVAEDNMHPPQTPGLAEARGSAAQPPPPSLAAPQEIKSAANLASLQGQRSAGPSAQRPQIDPNILSRMVTVQGAGASAGVVPFRVASMQEFRRSRNSLNTVPEAAQQPRLRAGQNQAFALNRPTGPRPMASQNPLLKMMEQRMAANAATGAPSTAPSTVASSQPSLPTIRASPSPPPLSDMSSENKAALQASINKWSGMSNAAAKPVARPAAMASPQLSSTRVPLGRAPLSPKQIDLLKELTTSQNVTQGVAQPSAQPPSQPVLQSQSYGMSQNGLPRAPSPAGLVIGMPQPARPGLTRCAVSLAEVDRLRRENQSIQYRQQLAMQERAMQSQQSIAANTLLSMQAGVGQQGSVQSIGGQVVTQEMLNQIQANTLNRIKKMSSGELNRVGSSSAMKPSRSSSALRKRRSIMEPDTDEEDDASCSKGSFSSHTHSMGSSASSNKIHRSLSHCSARAALTGSMENLRIKSQSQLLGGSRNDSFSSGLLSARNQSYSAGLNMQNQSFSSGSNASTQRSASQAALRRSSSSNGWIQSMLAGQNSAGKAAATFELALQLQGNTPTSPSQEVPSSPIKASPTAVKLSPAKEETKVDSPKPIQVQAEEYSAPSIERPASSSSEKVIVSALPDRIKYQNAEADTKPLDVVKEALAARGAKCETKPSMDMADDFFTKVTDMYDQDVVNAIRSNDVEKLRKLHEAGTTLQCGNRFGETLTHLACRRSHREVAIFLVNEVGVSLRVRDDYGRTPMHDACWRAEPDLELLDFLLDQAPELLMLSDKRGHTPLDYSRREHWGVLVPFLRERANKFRPCEE